ncbi:helix-turn-helix domain-containing protein [Bradyrhizobium sp. AUGA SZCCT0177]|uniref:helix-turn-helix domain-containing protein n=1 Tax=Bradyrhizobium sp. AUGA SZCCT0177 TaxID=2807665 RepID=UPI001BA97E4B|nr:helix-turn-helix domain-containing protein [Bradyrhizobium sp. AUGA SZCCT0177]MBR1285369.1 helix-turn-helix domain-containing protein [Bradyrhizobium sp. AUGA SZCCT0177]
MQTGPSDTFVAHKAISLARDLTGTEKRVAATIIDHYNRKTGRCDPALSSIARLLGLSRRTIIRAVGSLALKGYIRKVRHGGYFHRNSYEPVWSRFRSDAAKWTEQRATARHRAAADVSLSGRQTWRLGSDADVTQTCTNNSFEQTLAANSSRAPTPASSSPATPEGLGNEGNKTAVYAIAQQRFHMKSSRSHVAARDAAERRWNDSLTRQFSAAPDVFVSLIDAIDSELQGAATDVELRRPGSGIAFLLSELDRRLPLLQDAQCFTQAKARFLLATPEASGNSDREGSAVAADFQSLNNTKHQA